MKSPQSQATQYIVDLPYQSDVERWRGTHATKAKYGTVFDCGGGSKREKRSDCHFLSRDSLSHIVTCSLSIFIKFCFNKISHHNLASSYAILRIFSF